MQVEKTMLMRAAEVLDRHKDFVWTVQGFGMIRTYLDDAKEWRLNVWDSALKVPLVSEIHDHPWDFESWIMCGRLANIRFERAEEIKLVRVKGETRHDFTLPFQHVQIVTGEGGGPVSAPTEVRLLARKPEIYTAGDGYRQGRKEIHVTNAIDGTVTLNRRSAATPEHTANIYWPRGPWVSAEPRLATPEEVAGTVAKARQQALLLRHLEN